VRISTRGVRAAALLLTPSSEGDDSLLFVQTVDGDALPPEGLLPAGRRSTAVDFDLDGTPARMTVLLLPPDGTFHDVSFLRAGRRVVFRFRGDPEKPFSSPGAFRAERRGERDDPPDGRGLEGRAIVLMVIGWSSRRSCSGSPEPAP